LKSAADSHFLLTRGQLVVLSAPEKVWVDAQEFERRATVALKGAVVEAYEGALAIYEGDLLIEDLYEDWAATRRARSVKRGSERRGSA